MFGTGWSFSRQARGPRGGGGWYILCPEGTKLVRALCPGVHKRAPAVLQQRRLADAQGAAHQHHTVAAVPQPAHGPLLFRLGSVPPCQAPPCSARLDTTLLKAREPHDRLNGTSLTRWRHPIPGGLRGTRGRRPGPFARSGRCKSNGTRHLHGPVRWIRSLASRLRTPPPIRRPSLGTRGESLLSNSCVNGRPQTGRRPCAPIFQNEEVAPCFD